MMRFRFISLLSVLLLATSIPLKIGAAPIVSIAPLPTDLVLGDSFTLETDAYIPSCNTQCDPHDAISGVTVHIFGSAWADEVYPILGVNGFYLRDENFNHPQSIATHYKDDKFDEYNNNRYGGSFRDELVFDLNLNVSEIFTIAGDNRLDIVLEYDVAEYANLGGTNGGLSGRTYTDQFSTERCSALTFFICTWTDYTFDPPFDWQEQSTTVHRYLYTSRIKVIAASVEPPAVSVPEPSIIALFAAGLFGIGFARRRRS